MQSREEPKDSQPAGSGPPPLQRMAAAESNAAALPAAARGVHAVSGAPAMTDGAGPSPAVARPAAKPVRRSKKRVIPELATLGPRVLSLIALFLVLIATFSLIAAGYHAATDAFVAPRILGPDSEPVIESQLSLARLARERSELLTRQQEAMASAAASGAAIEKLQKLRDTLAGSLEWSSELNERTAKSSARDVQMLTEQRRLLEKTLAEQRERVAQTRQGLEAGVLRRDDLAREEDALNRLQAEALKTERDRLMSQTQLHTSQQARRALSQPSAPHAATPEMVDREQQLVKLELELLKLEADKTASESTASAAGQDIARLDTLIAQLKAQPLVQASEHAQTVAFVPYTQLERVQVDDAVYFCRVWGFFRCKPVGQVTQVVPGEVSMPDPWGTPTRGQYAVLALAEPDAARAKTLRVRSH